MDESSSRDRQIVKTNCVSLINYFKTPTNTNTNLPLLVCGNVRNHSIDNFEPNVGAITQHRAQANGEQPASFETENFDDAAVNWLSDDVTQNICFARQRNGAKSPINLRGVRFA